VAVSGSVGSGLRLALFGHRPLAEHMRAGLRRMTRCAYPSCGNSTAFGTISSRFPSQHASRAQPYQRLIAVWWVAHAVRPRVPLPPGTVHSVRSARTGLIVVARRAGTYAATAATTANGIETPNQVLASSGVRQNSRLFVETLKSVSQRVDSFVLSGPAGQCRCSAAVACPAQARA
jgi:hypothetical protein